MSLQKNVHLVLGRNLRLAREAQQVTLAMLAEATGVAEQELDSMEAGKTKMDMEIFIKFFQYLGVSPARLLEGMPLTVPYAVAAAPAPALMLRESDTQEFLHNFFKVNGPNRGDKFKSLVKQVKKQDSEEE